MPTTNPASVSIPCACTPVLPTILKFVLLTELAIAVLHQCQDGQNCNTFRNQLRTKVWLHRNKNWTPNCSGKIVVGLVETCLCMHQASGRHDLQESV